jgi:hypothetical protein
VFEGLDYPHDLSHDLSERTVYIPSTSLCCYNQQRVITPSDHGVLVVESLTKDSLFAAIQQRLSGMSSIINCICANAVEDIEGCLEDLFIRMIYLMTCRKGLSIYPLLLFVVITNKE